MHFPDREIINAVTLDNIMTTTGTADSPVRSSGRFTAKRVCGMNVPGSISR